MPITVDWSTPVFATDWIRAGLIALTPTIMSRPASAGMATEPTTPPKARTTIAITKPATSSASRVRAPACTTSDDADIEPPTGIPWKSPARMLPAPCPTKSSDASVGEPSGFGNPAETPAPWTRPTKASDTAGTRRKNTSPSAGRLIDGSAFGIVARSRTCSDDRVVPVEHRGQRRAGADRDDHAERTEAGPLQDDDEHDRDDADDQRRPVDPPGVREQVERAREAMPARRVIAREVVELSEDDLDADGADEAHHDRGRNEAQKRTETQDAGQDHRHTGEDRQGEQRLLRVGPRRQVGVGDDDRHRAGRLHRHERRARHERAADRSEQVSVQPGERVHPGEQTARQSGRDALDAEHQARDRIILHRATIGHLLPGAGEADLHSAIAVSRAG